MERLKRPNIRPLLFLAFCLLVVVHPLTCRGEAFIPARNGGHVTSGSEQPAGEKIFVHTDREAYIAGEKIWFQVYLLDARSGRLTSTSNLVYVEILNSENRPVMQMRIMLEEGCGPGEANLPDTLSSGSYLLRAYTGAMKYFMPDGCFMKRINIYNALRPETYLSSGEAGEDRNSEPAAGQVTVEMSSADSYGTREKIILEFDVRDNGPASAGAARLSIAVALLTGYHGTDITTVMTQQTQGMIVREEKTSFGFEREYHFIHGRLFNRNTQMPDSGKYLFMSIPGKNAVFFYSRTDGDGRFSFSIPADRVTRELIIQPEVVNPDNTIRIESSFSGEYPMFLPGGGSSTAWSLKQVSLMKVNYQVSRIYETENSVPPPELPTAAKPVKSFYGIPDISLDLDDFIRLPVMQEVFYELVPGVTLRDKRPGYEITVADPYYNVVYGQPPITFIDGVVVSDPAVIAGLDPDHVERIDVIRDRYVVGDYIFFGLVNIITYDGDYSRVSLPAHAVRLPYRVADPVRKFYSPHYSTPERRRDRTPDFRNTLYWEPSVTPSGDGKYRVEFWSSDVAGDYEINLQGVTADGAPVSFHKVIKIK